MNELIGFLGLGTLMIVQISLFAYGYGVLNQKVSSIEKRLESVCDRLQKVEEKAINLALAMAKGTSP